MITRSFSHWFTSKRRRRTQTATKEIRNRFHFCKKEKRRSRHNNSTISARASGSTTLPVRLMATDGGDAEEVLAKFAEAGIDYDKLATDLQREAAESFVKDWNEMLAWIVAKSASFKAAG